MSEAPSAAPFVVGLTRSGTTLLRMMTGLADTSSGTVTVFGEPVRPGSIGPAIPGVEMKLINPEPGKWDFAAADAFVAFGKRHDMFLIGHTLVWHNQTPAWFFEGEGGQPAGTAEMRERMRRYIETVAGRYAGQRAEPATGTGCCARLLLVARSCLLLLGSLLLTLSWLTLVCGSRAKAFAPTETASFCVRHGQTDHKENGKKGYQPAHVRYSNLISGNSAKHYWSLTSFNVYRCVKHTTSGPCKALRRPEMHGQPDTPTSVSLVRRCIFHGFWRGQHDYDNAFGKCSGAACIR